LFFHGWERTSVILIHIRAVCGDGYIDLSKMKETLYGCGFKLPGWKVHQMMEEYGDKRQMQHRGRLSFHEFEKMCLELKSNEVASKFKQVVSKKGNLETLGGMSDASSEGTTHSV
jgi:plastin-3